MKKTRGLAQKTTGRGQRLKDKWRREEEVFIHLPREERPKTIYKKHIGLAVDVAKMLSEGIGRVDLKETAGIPTKDLKTRLGYELTMALKD